MTSLKAFQEALRHSPENVPLLLLYGLACLDELQFDEAVKVLTRAVELDPRRADAQLGLAKALLFRGEASKAAVRAELVLQQEPGNAAAHLILSRVHLTEGDAGRARTHFERAVALDPSLADAGLEKALGVTRQDVRRAQAGAAGQEIGGGVGAGVEAGGQSFSDAGAGGAEGDEEFFMDEPPFDWRPETFWAVGDPERERVTFEDVGGLEAVKEEIRRKMLYPLQQPDLQRAYGRGMGGGILLYGPPGCGKSLVLRAVAGEIPCNYLAVGLHEIFDPYFGSTERNLHQVFEMARSQAPCVLVLDGLDSLGQDRRQMRESQLRNVVNQLLHEMDALRSGQHRVLVMAATNQPWTLDPALCRPGRFDQSIFVPPPDAATRRIIFQQMLDERPVGVLDLDLLVAETDGFSGADLCWVMDRAAELALGQAVLGGTPVPISGELMLEVAREHRATVRDWLESAASHRDEGGLVGRLLQVAEPKASSSNERKLSGKQGRSS